MITRGRVLVAALLLLQVVGIGYLLQRDPEQPLTARAEEPVRTVELARLGAAETAWLGWDPGRLDAVFAYANGLGSDTLMIVTDGTVVAAFGDTTRRHHVRSIRKSILSGVVGQHVGRARGRFGSTPRWRT